MGNAKKLCIHIFILFNFFCFAKDIEFDNPWLYLKAIKESYPDIAGDLFFDSEENDWCIKLRDSYLYWASGRLLTKKNAAKWEKWNPFISYFYPENIPNPQDYTENAIEALKPTSLIKQRRNAPFPNYTFHNIVYEGQTKQEIIKQLKKLKFFGINIWVHKRIVQALKRIEKKILELQKSRPEVRLFVKNITACWGFNWRVIADSGKLSNHCWGTAIDILPKNYRNKKIYWFWEAIDNDYWMKIAPYKRWKPPEVVIKIFEEEGFIWGGKWDLWDNMHFEYRPELIYIRDFILSQNPNKPFKTSEPANTLITEKEKANNIASQKTGKPSNKFNAVMDIAKVMIQIQYFTEEMQYKYDSALEFFKAELNENLQK